MVKLRLRRTGKKKQPSYQIIAIDSRKNRDGAYLEKIGHYFPLQKKWDVDHELARKWLKTGAQMSDVVRNIFRKEKVTLK